MRWFVVVAWLCAAARAEAGEPGERVAVAVLAAHCAPCHTGADGEGELGFVTDAPRLIEAGFIVPGSAARSPLLQRVEAGDMPPAGAPSRPTPAERAALRAWVDGLAPVAARLGSAELARMVAADAAALPAEARAHARWLVAERARDRVAVAILVNSLSWSPGLHLPVAVDRDGLLLRLDLRALGWTAATWDAIAALDPYARVGQPVRADWFVATASRPALYHAILALPDTEAELARQLGVDLADNRAAERVVRAGFVRSGVSAHNRVIERHATRDGALWRSFDFRSSVGRENIFAHPRDFVPAGGELIANLPNGLQLYLLVDAAGRRIDRAPTEIVSDPRRPDRAVETAVSCIGCHAAGIIERADELRRAAPEVARMHPPAARLAAIYARDRARFAAALAQLGAAPTTPADEPVTALVARYEADLDLDRAAAELGVAPAAVVQSPRARRLLAAGTVKRDAWAAAFADIAGELGAGLPARVGAAAWLDPAGGAWLRLADRRDLGAARAACAARRLVLPGAAELAAALAQGLATAGAWWAAGARLDAANQPYAQVVDARGGLRRADPAERHAVACVQRAVGAR